ncbi:capsular polysaccharide synthesis protein [Latilactobacillus curvatus]|uniref:capsular polysaccharide synthesis protein n=1 Tax=Latilactobacillus curvatus TaxID=28038 RepID=UPI0020C78E57|nr:capsular polysaccharide synthesis protein [Latilactobacillus curvatus]MCP8862326.1 capsular polysaccharide synthesis protein [Latilactobacillus curvatus]
MKLLKKIKQRFESQGGIKLVKQYKDAGVLLYALLIFPFLCSSKTGLEIFRNAISERIHKKLTKKYMNTVIDEKYSPDSYCEKVILNLENNKKPIWFMWLQGIDKAPELVRNNFEILNSSVERERIKLITEENIMEYVSLPSFILNKWKSGIISNTHLSDIIRLELLVRYGGIWIDSTVMLAESKIPWYVEEADFFVPQSLKPGRDGRALFVSSWLMTSKKRNDIAYRTLELLYLYWSKKNVLIDYFLVHHLLEVVFLEKPQLYKKIIPIDNSQMHTVLISVIRDNLMVEDIEKQIGLTSFQKLSNKVSTEQNDRLIDIQKKRLLSID